MQEYRLSKISSHVIVLKAHATNPPQNQLPDLSFLVEDCFEAIFKSLQQNFFSCKFTELVGGAGHNVISRDNNFDHNDTDINFNLHIHKEFQDSFLEKKILDSSIKACAKYI